MQAIVIVLTILQQQRRRPRLPGVVAAFQERLVAIGIADVDPHRLVPAIGDGAEPRVERGPQLRDQVGQRIGEILVLAAAEAVTRPSRSAAEVLVIRIEPSQRGAFFR